MSQVTVSQAAKLTGKSRETINNATKEGKLSCSRNGQNHKVIDVAELERVWPLVKTMAELKQEPATVRSSPADSPVEPDPDSQVALLREKLNHAEATNELLSTERQRERRQLEDEIENLRKNLERVQEQHNKALLLITDQSDQTKQRMTDWEASIKSLETRLANHEQKAEREKKELETSAKRKLHRMQQQLEAEKSKSLFRRLFG